MSGGAVDYAAEYDNRARVPEHAEIITGWERDAAAYREARAATSELGLSYGAHPRQFVDLFFPDHPDPERPLVVFVHGGYWRSLEPRSFSHFAAGANRRGYPVALPGYRLCPEVKIADIIEDVRAACLFLHRRLKRRMVVAGHSAGGHLAAALVATDWGILDASVPADLVRRGLAISGIFDLAPILHTPVNVEARMDAEEARAMSPAFWGLPPAVRFDARVGSTESSEFLRQGRLVAERWRAEGATTSFGLIEGANHFTAPVGLREPESGLVATLVALCETLPR